MLLVVVFIYYVLFGDEVNYLKIILAENISENILDALDKVGFEVIKSAYNPAVADGLNCHPDMQIAKIGSTLICDPSLYDYYQKQLTLCSNLIPGEALCTCNYPGDIAYNVKVIGDKVFHNFKYTDSVVKEYVSDRTLIDVSQGYSGCSICSVCDRGIITADRKIACKAEENGIDALLITPGNIILPGFDCGFIGGASFFWDNTVYFFGTISNHPDYSKIIEFCKSHGADIAMITHEPLTDYGSAIVIG
jgi:hypothetical protein